MVFLVDTNKTAQALTDTASSQLTRLYRTVSLLISHHHDILRTYDDDEDIADRNHRRRESCDDLARGPKPGKNPNNSECTEQAQSADDFHVELWEERNCSNENNNEVEHIKGVAPAFGKFKSDIRSTWNYRPRL